MTEAEFVAVTEDCKKLLWLKDFMKELGKEQMTPSLYTDSQSAIDLVNNPVYDDRTMHIDICSPLHPHSFKRRCVITGEDTHESESHRHADQGGQDGEAEDMLSLHGSSRVKIQS